MNRLVIIGNGFDLAHGLPTSYRNFIDDYWTNVKDSKHNDDFISFQISYDVEFKNSKGLHDIAKSFKQVDEKVKFSEAQIYTEYGNNFMTGKYPRRHILIYKNSFFKAINQKNIQNWVDIENEYYRLLKESLKNHKSITELNREFDEVKKHLEEYLFNNIEEKFEFSPENNKEVLNIFQFESYEGNKIDEFYKEISIKGRKKIREDYQTELQKRTGYRTNDYRYQKINVLNFFLSFNYTSTVKKYMKFLNIKDEFLNEIHGSIIEKSNPINFGFGDEMDDDYKIIENINDNDFLKNIKSFQYLHTHNYRRLLDVIDSKVFQVYLMGHSCGLSDRTLLNTIFEHENCCSIKIYYHKKEDGSDNYTEITQNISRHFNDKKLMREKIVNKTLCQPLPQIQLPKK